jgi:osmotically inducible protein OsmC
MATRNGSAKWTGDLKTGSGEVTVGEGAWTSAYSGRSRFAGVLPGFESGEGTNPEELLAAAHAACFSMALSLGLSDAGHPPSSINTAARVHLRVVGGAPAIQQIDLTTEADVPGLGQEEFQDHAEQAKASCIISRALGGRIRRSGTQDGQRHCRGRRELSQQGGAGDKAAWFKHSEGNLLAIGQAMT